ncbi:hypothetical protein ZWY2020_042686 [Hordeum vulgare]|nr:hypothetical protein ZWY2020_042686 [Hordeum vulgare]
MAEEEANYGLSVPDGATVPRGDLLIRVLDQAGKGEAFVVKDPASSSAGDNVAAMLDRLNLTTHESTAFVLEEDDEEYPGCPTWALVGKVLAPNTLHISMIKVVLRPVWGNPRGLEFHPLGANRFLAEFGSKADKDRVSGGLPWTISKHCILLKEFDPALRPSDVCFDTLTMWVRILNLPFGLMNDDRGKALASTLGKVEKMDVDDKGRAWGDYLRVRVSVDVNQPLMRCVSVFSQKRKVTDVYEVKYERLSLFCFSIGCVGHSSVVCPTPGERDAEGLLPYHSSRLCVPDDKKKKHSGANPGQSSYSKNTNPGPSDGVPAPNNAPSRVRGKETAGERIPTLKQRKPRANRAKINASTDVNKLMLDGTEGTAGSGKLAQISGKKRKVYQPKVQVPQEEQDTSPLPMILVSNKGTPVVFQIDTARDGQLPVVENNKNRELPHQPDRRIRQRLWCSPARRNESFMLELSRAWVGLDSW